MHIDPGQFQTFEEPELPATLYCPNCGHEEPLDHRSLVTGRKLSTGTYASSPEFMKILAHEAVRFQNDDLVAVTGPLGDTEGMMYSVLFAKSPDMFQALNNLVNAVNKPIVDHKEDMEPELTMAKRLLADIEILLKSREKE